MSEMMVWCGVVWCGVDGVVWYGVVCLVVMWFGVVLFVGDDCVLLMMINYVNE